jgi:exoribonuclease R
MKCKVIIHDRTYTSWSYINEETNQPIEQEILSPPVKLFSKDIILYDPLQNTISTVYSNVRTTPQIAGVLLLDGNKTFGRIKNKLLYKCIPDDKHLPFFLIPCDPKIGFSKVFKNKYVIFKFDHWENQHPQGILITTIGTTDNLESFYEYQLYCKSLHISLGQFTNNAREQLQKQSQEEYIDNILKNPDFKIEDRRGSANPFTIDPIGSLDFDDAFDISQKSDRFHLTIYIANVYVWLETLHLWKSFANRVSTIYLPDKKRPMLPTVLSDSLCSLQENQSRFAVALDIILTPEGQIISTDFKNVIINVKKNYRYEEPQLLDHQPYQYLFDLSKKLDKSITDSHDIVSYWMIRMNRICGEHLSQMNEGIFRKITVNPSKTPEIIPQDLPPATHRMITSWNSVSGQYVRYQEQVYHDFLKCDHYAQTTSPIRRLVDLLNLMILSQHYKLIQNPSKDATNFLESWLSNLEYLNISMRSIRKIQTNCELLHRCITTPSLIQTNHQGILFDKLQKNDGAFIYMVYMEELKLLTRLKTYIEYPNYSAHQFRLFLFVDEHNLRQKIRVQIL